MPDSNNPANTPLPGATEQSPSGQDMMSRRELSVHDREHAVAAREEAAGLREEAASLREETSTLREEAIRAREEAAQARSELGQLMAQIREANERLVIGTIRAQTKTEAAEEANRLKDEFLATVSHELRTPLNAVLGWARMLRSGQMPPARAGHAIATIERNASVLGHLIDDLLDVSRIVAGTLRLAPQPVDLVAVVQAALDVVRPLAVTKSVQLAFSPDLAAIETVGGDAGRLQQVIWNLLANAIKFTPEGGRVDVLIERSEDHIEVRVVDTGQGIDPELLPHVFERFRQADDATTRRHTGLGLGLAIVRQLVELHGGTVHATSEGVGRGAAFIVPALGVLGGARGAPCGGTLLLLELCAQLFDPRFLTQLLGAQRLELTPLAFERAEHRAGRPLRLRRRCVRLRARERLLDLEAFAHRAGAVAGPRSLLGHPGKCPASRKRRISIGRGNLFSGAISPERGRRHRRRRCCATRYRVRT